MCWLRKHALVFVGRLPRASKDLIHGQSLNPPNNTFCFEFQCQIESQIMPLDAFIYGSREIPTQFIEINPGAAGFLESLGWILHIRKVKHSS